MSTAFVQLIDVRGTMVRIVGEQPTNANDDVSIQKLAITRPSDSVELTLLSTTQPKIPRAFLKPIGSQTPPVYEFVQGARSFSLQSTWAFTGGGNLKFFGVELRADAGIDIELQLNVAPTGSSGAAPFLVLSANGQVILSGAAVESVVSIGFRVVIDDFPTVASLPALELDLPGDIPWPKLRLPWPGFPDIPNLPWRLPAHAFSLPALPLSLNWKAVDINVAPADGTVRVHVQQLEIVGVGSTLSASFDIVFKKTGDSVDVAIENVVLSNIEIKAGSLMLRQFTPGCFGFDWKSAGNKGVEPLLRLMSQELSETTSSGDMDLKLRVHASGRDVEEIRLDWMWSDNANRDVALPGFNVSLPQPDMMSLIVRRDASGDDNDAMRITLAATYPEEKVITTNTTFSWPVDDREKELLREGDGKNSDSLITVTATSVRPVSLVLFDLPLSSDGQAPRLVQQLTVPLSPLDEQETNAGGDVDDVHVVGLFDPCPTTPLSLTKLKKEDWKFDADTGFIFDGDFKLPFLNSDSQFLKVKLLSKNISADLVISAVFEITAKIGDLELKTTTEATFDLTRMAFDVKADKGLRFVLKAPYQADHLGLTWQISGNQKSPDKPDDPQIGDAFILVLQHNNYQLRQAPGAEIVVSYTRATSKERPIRFRVTEFALTPKGINMVARVTDDPARLNGLETQFRFTEGVLKITENRIAGFTIAGTGPLPPALVGDATADIALQFEQRDGDRLKLVAGGAQIKGSKLLSCKASRFEFELDGLGLKFVDDDGGDHLYFTLSGKARYKPMASDDSSGPLSWLPKIEIQLVECPLTGNMRVVARHVRFMIDLPKKLKFDFLGCFQMELRGIGFLPQFDGFGDESSAMQLSGQIMFADSGGDVMETKIDFHNLYVALPEPGSFIPRVHLKGLTIHMKQGESFRLYGSLAFFDGEDVEPGIPAKGFTGEGEVSIQGLPTMAASFAFLRVSGDAKKTWKRAWFIYLEARELSLKVPVIEIALREVGLGFGYRYTLASFKAIDNIQDPKKLLKELKRLARTQGNLAKRDQWRVDLEQPGEDARWTVVLRALFSQTTLQAGPWGDYDAKKEELLACMFVFDVVIALRSDLTFFMAGRGWLNTNYVDFRKSESLRDHPLFAAFVMLSPRQKRFLANLSSQPDAEFGDHPPLPGFLKDAIRGCRFSATLLIEPGLFHSEIGWPNQLQWKAKIGPLEAEFRGGTIFRVSETELVVGNSFLARGRLEMKAEVSAGFFGASLFALAQVAYGARYIGVLAFKDTTANSAFYGAVGIDIRVAVGIEFWIKIKLIIKTIKLSFRFSFELTFTASLEVGITLTDAIGLHGMATVGLKVMGRNLHFDVRVGLNESAVTESRRRTERFLKMGLESEDVDQIPGTDSARIAAAAAPGQIDESNAPDGGDVTDSSSATAAAVSPPPLSALNVVQPLAAEIAAAAPATRAINIPDYSLTSAFSRNAIELTPNTPERFGYYLFVPSGTSPGFYAVPPADGTPVTSDFEWDIQAVPTSAGSRFEHFVPSPNNGVWTDVPVGRHAWKVDWDFEFSVGNLEGTTVNDDDKTTLRQLLRYAYLLKDGDSEKPFGDVTPKGDPLSEGFSAENTLADQRVLNPTATAFEAAVRGAAQQFVAPYFKFDPKSDYDTKLKAAFHAETTIYSPGGELNDTAEAQQEKRATQLRSSVLQAIIRDFQRYVELSDLGDAGANERAQLEKESLAFRMGLIFRARVPEGTDQEELRWLEDDAKTGTLKQRKGVDSTSADSIDHGKITAFHREKDSFVKRTPRFVKVRKFEHANTIAFHWELQWPEVEDGKSLPEFDPEHYLRYYKVRRVHLDGNDPEAEFTLKAAAVLHREIERDQNGDPIRDADGNTIEKRYELLPRFQLVDHFNGEVEADVSALTAEGKTYLYTIIPVDLEGKDSPRPLTMVATRFPATPPLVPTDGELVVNYAINDRFTNLVPSSAGHPVPASKPILIDDKDCVVHFRWTDPVAADNQPSGPIKSYSLVFRREQTMPIGFFGADQDTRGQLHNGFPVTNARRLRNDIVIPFKKPPRPEENGQYRVLLDRSTLINRGVLPPGDVDKPRDWKPEAWRIFIQTTTLSGSGQRHAGVSSSLAPVKIVNRFLRREDFANLPEEPPVAVTEVRQSGILEWISKPVRFDLLPPWDQTGKAGFAKVPMPGLSQADWSYPLDGSGLDRLTFEQHPDRLRAIEFRWNQGPSDNAEHPLALHARYDLFEFDCDAITGDRLDMDNEALDPVIVDAAKLVDFQKFERRSGLRPIQIVELLPASDLALVPSDTLTPQAWEAWYPAISRRLLNRLEKIRDNKWPKKSELPLGPWYSWRESFLEWPDPGMTVKNAVEPPGEFDADTQRVWPFHKLLRAILSEISLNGLTPEQRTMDRTNPKRPFPRYSVEIQPQPARATGDTANANPPQAVGFDSLMTDTSPATDPYGWSLLQRMGLSIAIRIRDRLTGDYMTGQPLADLIRDCINAARIRYDDETENGITGHLKFLHIEHLFQPGERTRIAEKEPDTAGPAGADQLLALTQISLRPALRQRLLYQRCEFRAKATDAVPPGTSLELEWTCNDAEATYQIASGSPGSPVPLAKSPNSVKSAAIMPTNGVLTAFVRAVNPDEVKIKVTAKIRQGNNDVVVELDAARPALSPLDWEAVAFTAPLGSKDQPNAPFEIVELNVAEANRAPKTHWNRFCHYVSRAVRPVSPNPVVGISAVDVSTSLLKDDSARGKTLAWLDRFFGTGGDVKPNNGGTIATTDKGPWIASAYPRAMTPMALAPNKGRLTYRHLVEDQWAHAYRYLIRPRGRYDLLWAAIGDARNKDNPADFLFLPKDEHPGQLAAMQRWTKAPAAKDTGGTDIVLQRIRAVAPPLVLSSRRLDQIAPPGQSVPPGAVWEVMLAKHPEQSLIEKNRSLFNYLSYRQMSHALFRRLTITDEIQAGDDKTTAIRLWQQFGQRVATGLYDSDQSPIVKTAITEVFLVRGSVTTPIPLTSLKLKDVAAALPADLNASVERCGEMVVLALKPAQAAFPLELRVSKDEPLTNLLSQTADWSDSRFEAATGALIGRYQTKEFDDPSSPVLTTTDLKMELVVFQPTRGGISPADEVVHELTLAENKVSAVLPALEAAFVIAKPSDVRILGELRTIKSGATLKVGIFLTAEQPVARVELRTIPGDPATNLLTYVREEPGLPRIPSRLDHLDLDSLTDDELCSLDMPMRQTEFVKGAVSLQFMAMPFYYEHKMLVIAQTSHVVSPITEVTHRDFEYVSPEPMAVMEGISSKTPNGTDGPRLRRIAIRLGRYWDCLPSAAKARWETEHPGSVSTPDKRRYSALPDKDVVYQVIVRQPSGTVEVLAEYRFNPDELFGYESQKLEGAYEGIAVRQLPNGKTDPELFGIDLETLLKPRAGVTDSIAWQTVTSRFDFESKKALLRTFANLQVGASDEVVLRHAPSACVWTLDGDSDLTPDEISALRLLIPTCDTALASGIRSLLSQSGPRREAVISVGLEQLAEIATSRTDVTITEVNREPDAPPEQRLIRGKIRWAGALTALQKVVWEHWLKSSPFTATLTALRDAIEKDQILKAYPADASNPKQADTSLPSARLKIEASGFTWEKVVSTPLTTGEKTELERLRDNAAFSQAARNAFADLLADLNTPSPTVDIIDVDWRPRPKQSGLPDKLRDRIRIGNGVIGFAGLMIRDEARQLLEIAGLAEVNRPAILRLLETTLQSGLNGGRLELRTRRGSAVPISRPISASYS